MVICLSGENTYNLRAELNVLTAAFIDQYGDMAVERLDGETVSFERMQESLQSLPFLASRKMVVLRTPGTNKRFAEEANALLGDLLETTEVVIVEPKLDKRGSYYKFLKNKTNFREYPATDENGLTDWLVEEAKVRGGAIKRGDARYLVERVGVNQQLLNNELEKLIIYQPAVTRESIDLLTEPSPQSSIFDLIEAAFAGKSARALEQYQAQREQKVDTAQIIAMLAWQLRILALVKTADNRSVQEIASTAKQNPYVIRKTQAMTRNLSIVRLKELISSLLAIDIRSKRENIDVDEALQNYLLSLSE